MVNTRRTIPAAAAVLVGSLLWAGGSASASTPAPKFKITPHCRCFHYPTEYSAYVDLEASGYPAKSEIPYRMEALSTSTTFASGEISINQSGIGGHQIDQVTNGRYRLSYKSAAGASESRTFCVSYNGRIPCTK